MTDGQRDPFQHQYEALTEGFGLFAFSRRTQIELTGPDRATFLHNFCTNDIKRLAPGEGCEAFITNVQGKTISHIFVFSHEESLVLDAVGDQAETILGHLDRYLIREEVILTDRSADWGELLLSGPGAGRWLSSLGVNSTANRLDHVQTNWKGLDVSIRHADLTGPNCYLISASSSDLANLSELLVSEGAVPCDRAAFDAARIEMGTPLFGQDIGDGNLPQEISRDEFAISFTKGCYLGQETVARIDALGHVNRQLVGVRFPNADVVQSGLELTRDEKTVGNVTSAAYSPKLGCPLALAFVRRGSTDASTTLQSAKFPCQVIKLPVS